MKCFVIVREEPPGQFTAWPAGIPEMKVTAESRERARDAIFSKLFDSLRSGEIIALDLPDVRSFPKPDPIDPVIEAEMQQTYLDEILRIRREADEREGIFNGKPDELGGNRTLDRLAEAS